MFNFPVMFNSLWLHGLQHARPHCPSPLFKACPTLCPLHQRCHPTISSVLLFSFPQSFPASGTFPMNRLFTSHHQNTVASASASVLARSIPSWFPIRLTDLISLLSKGLSGVYSIITIRRHRFLDSAFFMVQLSQLYVTTGKTIALTIQTFLDRVLCLLFNTPSTFVIDFLPRNNHLLISLLQSPSTVILETKKKSVTNSTFSLIFVFK